MNQLNTIQSTINYIKNELSDSYNSRELETICFYLLEHVLQLSRTQIQLNKSQTVEDVKFNTIEDYTSQLKTNKPIQYVLGEAYFYDLPFKVNEHTLIPRPETEELVHAIIQENPQVELDILDIGTGSGCIPISLAKHMKQARVNSVDISEEALKIAQENADNNQTQVHFLHRDFLGWNQFEWNNYDIIVSNPPYVTEAEKDLMETNVLEYEPHTALFVSNNDPLIFYRAIADFAIKHLKENGKIYFEINEKLGQETANLLQNRGFIGIEIRKDINGKDRMVKAVKPAIQK